MKRRLFALVAALPLFLACGGDFRQLWHEVKLPSGQRVKVTMFMLVWGAEHDERFPNQDSFAMEFVSNAPQAEPEQRKREALEVFELMRPVSELWGFDHAQASGFPSTERKGRYDLFLFQRGADGKWSCELKPAKVFAND